MKKFLHRWADLWLDWLEQFQVFFMPEQPRRTDTLKGKE